MAEWISAKNDLPTKSDVYLIHIYDEIRLGWYDHHERNWRTWARPFHNWVTLNVTHWMLLPEPPEAKSWAACMGDARDGTIISITIDVSDSNLPLSEFESRVYKIFERAMTGIKREWDDDG